MMPNKLTRIDRDGVARQIEGLKHEFSEQENAFNHLATKVQKGHDKAVGELIGALFANVKDLKANLANAGLVHTAMKALLEAADVKYENVQAIEAGVGRNAALVRRDVQLANDALRRAGETTNEVRKLLQTMKTKYDEQFAIFQADQREQLDELTSDAREQIAMLVDEQRRQISRLEEQQEKSIKDGVQNVGNYIKSYGESYNKKGHQSDGTIVTRGVNPYNENYQTQMTFAFKF